MENQKSASRLWILHLNSEKDKKEEAVMKEITSKQLFCACVDRAKQDGGYFILTVDDIRDVSNLIFSEIEKNLESPFISSSVNAFGLSEYIGDKLTCLKISNDEIFSENAMKIESFFSWLSLIREYYMYGCSFASDPYTRFIDKETAQIRKNLPGKQECAKILLNLDRMLSYKYAKKEEAKEEEAPKVQEVIEVVAEKKPEEVIEVAVEEKSEEAIEVTVEENADGSIEVILPHCEKSDDACEEKTDTEILTDAQIKANEIIESAKREAEKVIKNAKRCEEEILNDYKSIMSEKKKEIGSFVRSDRANVKKEVVETRAGMEEVKKTLAEAQSNFDGANEILNSLSAEISNMVMGITGKLNHIASEVEFKNTECAWSQFSQVYDQICATYNGYLYSYTDEMIPKFDILNRLEMFKEIIECCLEDYELVAFETPAGEKFDVKKHKARVHDSNYDPRSSIVTRSLKKGFMWGDVVKEKEEVEISPDPAIKESADSEN